MLTDNSQEIKFYFNRPSAVAQPEINSAAKPPFKIDELILNYTSLCNGRCTYCTIWKNKNGPELNAEDFDNIFRAAQLKSLNSCYVTGGEPYISDKVVELAAIMHKHIPASMLTGASNGILMSKALERAIRIKKMGIRVQLQVSLNGMKHTHDSTRGLSGSWDKAVTLIDKLLENGIETCPTFSMMPHTINDFPFIRLFCKTRGLPLEIAWVRQSSRYDEVDSVYADWPKSILPRLKMVEDLPDYFDCPALKRRLAINPDGSVYPCEVFRKELFLGNIKEQSLEDILNAERAYEVDEFIQKRKCHWCQGPGEIEGNPKWMVMDCYRRQTPAAKAVRNPQKHALFADYRTAYKIVREIVRPADIEEIALESPSSFEQMLDSIVDDYIRTLPPVHIVNPQNDEYWQWLINVSKQNNDAQKELSCTQNWLNADPDSIPALLQALTMIIKYGEMSDIVKFSQKIMSLGSHPAAEKILEALGYLTPQKSRNYEEIEEEIPVEEASTKISVKTANDPEISVLLCSYNGGKKLPKFFEAIKRQTLSADNFEIVCVNDGSTDNTGELMREVLRNLPGSYHQHPVNRALAAARNTAIEDARGKLLLFINDDTYPEPDCLRQHLAFHRKIGKSHIASLGSVKFTQNVEKYLLSMVIERNNLLFPLVGTVKGKEYNHNYFVTANLCAPKALFADPNIRFNTSFRKYGCEDIELAYRLWQKGMRVMFNPGARVMHEHYMTLDDYIRREDNNNSNLVQYVEMHPELINDCFQVSGFDENVIRRWEKEIASFTPQYEELVKIMRPLDSLQPEIMTNSRNGNVEKLLNDYFAALQEIRRYVKIKSILQTLEKLPDSKKRLLHSARNRS